MKVLDIAEKTFSGPFGSNIKSSEYVKYGVPVIRGINLSGPRFYDKEYVYVTEEKADSLSSSIALPGDIVFVARGTIGLVGLVPNTHDRYVLSPNLVGLRVDPSIADPEYVFYYFRSWYGQSEIHSYVSTTGVPKIARALESLRKFCIYLPPLPEQRAIARILGTLDDKIELNRRMNETLEAMAQALFKSWFVDFDPVVVNALRAGNPIPEKFAARAAHYRANPDLSAGQAGALGLPEHILRLFPARFVDSELGPIPEGWEVKRLGSICHSPQYGYTASAKEERVGPKFLRIKDINKLPWISWREVPYCEISGDLQAKYLLRPGDIVIARIADPGHGALMEEANEAVFASYLIRFRLLEAVYDRYLQYWLRSEPYWQLVRGRQSGSTRSNLNAKVLCNFPLIIPPSEIASTFRQIVASLREKVIANVKEEETLAALRDTLLPKLISGELRVQDVEKFLKSRGL